MSPLAEMVFVTRERGHTTYSKSDVEFIMLIIPS